MYSNWCCSCSFEHEIIKIGQSFHKIYRNNILNFQESTTILNACTKKSGNLLNVPRIYIYIYTHTHIYIQKLYHFLFYLRDGPMSYLAGAVFLCYFFG